MGEGSKKEKGIERASGGQRGLEKSEGTNERL